MNQLDVFNKGCFRVICDYTFDNRVSNAVPHAKCKISGINFAGQVILLE